MASKCAFENENLDRTPTREENMIINQLLIILSGLSRFIVNKALNHLHARQDVSPIASNCSTAFNSKQTAVQNVLVKLSFKNNFLLYTRIFYKHQ